MSLSNPTERAINPAKKWFQWDSDSKGFKYYDKEAPHPTDAARKGANILVPLPFRFIVLDTLHTIGGFSDADSCGIYSNEIRDIKKENLSIRIKKAVVASGLYEAIKGKVTGSRYAQSLYIAYFDEKKELQIGNIKIEGSSLGPWIEFCKKNNPIGTVTSVSESRYFEKNKKVNWNEPVFASGKLSPETLAKAIELDKVLQSYLVAYFNHAKSETTPLSEVDTNTEHNLSSTSATEALMAEEPRITNVSTPAASSFDDDLPF